MLFESLEDFHPTPKMDDLKPISQTKFNELIKGKKFKGRKDYALKDLKDKAIFKPLVKRRVLVVSSEDRKPTKLDSVQKAAKAISIEEGFIRYVRKNERDFVEGFEDENLNPTLPGRFWYLHSLGGRGRKCPLDIFFVL